MQNYVGLNMETLMKSNTMSFVQCVLELVANSLTAQATAIAIRIHTKKREIYVIDNGIGIQKDVLEHIAEYEAKIMNNHQQLNNLKESNDNMLTNIRRLSDSFTIASRYQYSMETFIKTFKIGCASNFAQIEQRPLHGTTITVYGFYEVPLRKNWNIFTICLLIAAIAVTRLEVSFSIRDEEQKKVVLRIAKPHSSIEVLKILFGKNLPLNHIWLIQCNNINYHGYIGLSDKNTVQYIFLNDRLIYCPLILKLIKIGFKESLNLLSQEFNVQSLWDKNMFILFFLTFSQKEFAFVTENEKRYVIFYDMQKILNTIKNCVFKCLIEETAVSTGIPYLYKAQLLRQIYSKSERPVLNNINEHKNITLLKKKKIVTFKRKKITSRMVTNYSHTNAINTEKENSTASDIQYQIDITSAKYKLCEDKVTKKMYNDKTQENCINPTVTNNSIEYNKKQDCHIANNNELVDMISPLSEWSNWIYYSNSEKHAPMRNVHDTFSKEHIRLQQLFKCTRRFDFLPQKLSNLLQYHHAKLTNVKSFNSSNSKISSKEENLQHKQMEIHPCNLKQKLCEFRLSHASLKCIKVINQINNEFIAAWMMYEEMKILLMIDQHAVHERIRYENLLLKYKAQTEGGLLSVNLRNPLIVKLSIKTCNLLLRNKTLLKKYGISLGSLKGHTLLIRAIPQCLVTNNYNNEKILSKVYSLLSDIIKNRNISNHTNTLPLTIRNAIASEACHGAIKFGDELTFEQCTYLLELLKYTKSPNRCAHGRPTIIPVMELSELENRNTRLPEKKLNFASLKRHY